MRRWILSFALSAMLLAWVFRQADFAEMPGIVRSIHLPFLLLGLLAYLAGLLLRAWRYRVLLNGPAGLWPLVQVTQVRNMFADLLPARLGTLSYVYLLVRRFGADLGDALSSFVSVFFLDLAAVAPLAGLALLSLRGETDAIPVEGYLLAGAVLLAATVAALLMLPLGLGLIGGIAGRVGGKTAARIREGVADIGGQYALLRRRGALWPAFALSLGVRLAKYGSWYFLLLSVLRAMPGAPASLPFPRALLGVLGAELSSALPVGGLAGFGTYEAAWVLSFGAVGFSRETAALSGLTTHLLSQVIDYGLGVAALLLLYRPRLSRRRAAKAAVVAGLVALPLAAVAAPRFWNRWFPPDPGTASVEAEAESFRRAAEMVGAPARLVWSSNRGGSHEILSLDLPSGRLTALTSDPAVDFYPRFSPDGRRILFLRSRQEWVSFRDDSKWDVWLMGRDGGAPRRIAEAAYHPSWWPDGKSVVYHRSTRLFRLHLAEGREELLADGEAEPFGGRFETPYVSPDGSRVAFTLRGRWRGVGIWRILGGELLRPDTDDGCQICWGPGGTDVIWVSGGGLMKNRILIAPAGGGKARTLIDLPGEFSHEYFPRVGGDGRFLVFAASAGGHEHDRADYEIFLWEIGRPAESALRVTRHSGNDQWPDLATGP